MCRPSLRKRRRGPADERDVRGRLAERGARPHPPPPGAASGPRATGGRAVRSETCAAGSRSGSYAHTYDARGQQTASTLTVGTSSYPLGSTYDDAGNVLTQTDPDGQTATSRD